MPNIANLERLVFRSTVRDLFRTACYGDGPDARARARDRLDAIAAVSGSDVPALLTSYGHDPAALSPLRAAA